MSIKQKSFGKQIRTTAMIGLASLVLAAGSGCARLGNVIDRDGGLFVSTKAPYIVVKYSGGKITDVYKLEDSMVQSEEHSDGWLFKDQSGNSINISGDAKIIRLNSTRSQLWSDYREYHLETSGGKPYIADEVASAPVQVSFPKSTYK